MVKILSLIILLFSLCSFANDATTVDVPPTVSDIAIEKRLTNLIKVTQWYPDVAIEVNQGLVILGGSVEDESKREWIIKLAEKTEGVVAVIDKMEMAIPSARVFEPAFAEVQNLSERSLKRIPYILSALLILALTLLFSFFMRGSVKRLLRDRGNTLLADALSNVVLLVCLALGLYLALNMTGLSTLAVTVLGGTGIIGIGIGLALKSTFENYVSGIMISMRQIFKKGELISLLGHEGIVQAVTTRSTSIMDFEGNNVTIPNSEVFNATIRNYTRNPNMRLDFGVGIGYDDSIEEARSVISQTLDNLTEAVLQDPEYIVAVDSLGAATVNLRIYFWFNAVKLSRVKVRSLVIEKVKEALMSAGISMPDDAREVIFSSPLQVVKADAEKIKVETVKEKKPHDRELKAASDDLSTETQELQKQAERTGTVESGSNLLKQ